MIAYSKSKTSISVVLNFTPKIIPSSHPNFAEIAKLVEDPNATEKDLINLIDIPKAITTFTGGAITIQNGQLFYKGFEVKNALATLILQLVREGRETAAEPFKRFLEKANENPDPRAASDLYEWVVHSGLPITPDGDILAWKAVTANYRSIHSPSDERFDHHVGNTVWEDRTRCDPNPNKTCSRGLHFAAADYLPHYASGGSRIVAVKISPADVVAFPTDYGWSKGRAWKYVVVGEVPLADVPKFYPQGRRIYDGWAAKPAPVIPTKPDTTGQVWRTRDGRNATIIRTNAGGSYPVSTDIGFYTAEGRYLNSVEDSPFDLVTFIK